MLKVRCSLPSFRRILARRNMTAADYAHNRPQENPLGRHYSPFHNLQPCSFNDLQGAKAKNRCRIDEVRLANAVSLGAAGWGVAPHERWEQHANDTRTFLPSTNRPCGGTPHPNLPPQGRGIAFGFCKAIALDGEQDSEGDSRF